MNIIQFLPDTTSDVQTIKNVSLFRFPLSETPEGICASFRLPDQPYRFLAQYMMSQWWSTPRCGKAALEIPDETQVLYLDLLNGKYAVIMALSDGDARATIRGTKENTVEVAYDGTVAPWQKNGELLACAYGDDPFSPLDDILSVLRTSRKSFRFLTEKKVPDFVNLFGWCTWNAYYDKVTENDVKTGLSIFHKKGIKPGFLIIDDGWQQVEPSGMKRMLSFGADPVKFPSSLKVLSRQLKKQFKLKKLGVWHTITGYWYGVADTQEFKEKYQLSENRFNPYPPDHEPIWDRLTAPSPRAAKRFYDDFHRTLAKNGIDMVKIDNQSGLRRVFWRKFGRTSSARAYQKAMSQSVRKYFGNGMISCMCHVNDLWQNLIGSAVFRNSEDYFPKDTAEAQHYHINANAKNSVLFSRLAVTDWDMFQTHSRMADFHAAARALSGGPVYVSDIPEKTVVSVLEPFFGKDGVLLRPDRLALPSKDCFFYDVQKEEVLLKIVNASKDCALVGMFNCCDTTEKPIAGTASVADVPGVPAGDYAWFSFRTGTCGKGSSFTEKLGPEDFDIVEFAPIRNGVAVFGDPKKYLPAAVIRKIDCMEKSLKVTLACGGEVAVYSEKELRAAPMIPVKREGGLYVFDVRGTSLTMRIRD